MSNLKTLQELVAIDSPTGFTHQACQYIYDLLKSYGWQPEFTNKGAVKCSLGADPSLVIAAHCDTLGAIVSGILDSGHLSFYKLGYPILGSFEGEYCRIHTLDDKIFTGTLLLKNPSAHVNRESHTAKREPKSMYIRLDEEVHSDEDTEALGIRIGDIIAFDARYQETASGYIKSRFMDDKAGCFVLFEIARRLAEAGQTAPVELFFSNYEEVGHGASGGCFAPTIKEMLCIDMAVVGDNASGKETHCSICAADASTPYDYHFRKTLVQLATKHSIPYKIDIFPYYTSDGSAALYGGNDFKMALIGPGVHASHGMERTHAQGIEATIQLCLAYMETIKER